MEFKQCKINGQDVLADGIAGIQYSTQINWRKLITRDSQQTYDGQHGRNVSPTLVSARQVVLEGYIDRLGNTYEQLAVDFLQGMFSLYGQSVEEQTMTVYIKDPYDQEREAPMKVKEQLVIDPVDEYFMDYAYKWRVVLETIKKPQMYSPTELSVVGDEGEYGGFTMVFSLGNAWDDYINVIQVDQVIGNVPTYPRFEITVTGTVDTPLTIKDISTGKYFALDISATAGDVIIVDMKNKTATKNGLSVIGNRVIGSDWLSMFYQAYYTVQDADGYVSDDDLNVTIFYTAGIL